MKVDPSGLASAAQRITAALAQLPPGDEVHPPLAADPASQGGAARLTTGGSTLVALIGELASGLAATAEVLSGIGAGFDGIEVANVANLSSLRRAASSAPFTGFAPPAAHGPDVRPPLPPPAAVMGEAISRATHAGDPGAGEVFITGWSRVADALDDAATVVARVVDNLPETWSSQLSTPVVRAHLLGYQEALAGSASRARGLARQADQHAGDVIQARQDIPSPQEFDELNQRIRQTWQANRATGGKYAPALAALNARKADLNARAVQGFGTFYAKTDATTAAQLKDENPLPMDDPGAGPDGADPTTSKGDPAGGDQVDAGQGLDPAGVSPQSAGELAGLLPTLIPAVLGAAGGLVGGVMSTLTKAPEALAQAATQAAGAAVQGVSGALGPGNDSPNVGGTDSGLPDDSSAFSGDGGETTPASGGPTSPTPPVVPSTGSTPTPPSMPAGGLPAPVEAAPAAGGMMPMGMPMGGMMPPGGAGSGAGGQKRQRPHHVVVPRTPHTESVTGKVSEDRIAVSSIAPPSHDPPDDDLLPPAKGPQQPLIRRITMAPRKDDDES